MTTEPTIDRARLRELAEAVPWGPWRSSEGSFGLSTFPPATMLYTVRREGMSTSPAAAHSYSTQGRTADFIAAVDPQTVLALLDSLDRAEAQVAALREALEEVIGMAEEASAPEDTWFVGWAADTARAALSAPVSDSGTGGGES